MSSSRQDEDPGPGPEKKAVQLTPEEEQELAEAMEQIQRGEFVQAEDLLRELKSPQHRKSLRGSLAKYAKRSVSQEEWSQVREQAWADAVRDEFKE